MAIVGLKKIVNSKGNRQVLELLCEALGSKLIIQDTSGEAILGTEVGDSPNSHPIVVDGSPFGTVVGQGNLRVMAEVIARLANAESDKKSLAQETINSFKELNLFYAISQKMRACLSFQDVARLTLDEVSTLVSSKQASVMVLNKEELLEVVASVGKRSATKLKLAPGEGIAGHVFKTGEPELIADVSKNPHFVNNRFDVRSLMCIPLKVDQRVLGLLNVSSSREREYTAQDLKLASAVASHAGAAMETALLQQQHIEQDRVKQHLQRYVSPQVMTSILSASGTDPLKAMRKPVSVLFADIRNFTSMCEQMPAEKMVRHLNSFFSSLVDVLFAQGGTLDKFVGDMLFAFFNAPEEVADYEKRAVKTAILMQQCLQDNPDDWVRENFHIGIGVSSGPVVVGNVGSIDHSDYTAIGSTVNLGARLEAIARGGEILVSASVFEATKDSFSFEPRGEIAVKGLDAPLEIYEVIY